MSVKLIVEWKRKIFVIICGILIIKAVKEITLYVIGQYLRGSVDLFVH